MEKEPIALAADPADPEDFDVTDRGQRPRLIRRTGLGLSQAEFARRFHVPVGTLRDREQARVLPPDCRRPRHRRRRRGLLPAACPPLTPSPAAFPRPAPGSAGRRTR